MNGTGAHIPASLCGQRNHHFRDLALVAFHRSRPNAEFTGVPLLRVRWNDMLGATLPWP